MAGRQVQTWTPSSGPAPAGRSTGSGPSAQAAGGRGQRRRSERRLDREQVIAAAIGLVEEHGAPHLTMRRLAERLGVEAMSLYRYVPSRENLLDAVVETVMDELYGDPDVHIVTAPAEWQDYLVRLAHGVRRIAVAHPQVFPLVASRPTAAPWLRPPLRSLRWVESLIDTLVTQGFSDDGAVAAYRSFSSFLLGHLLLEVSALGADVGPIDWPATQTDSTAQHAKTTTWARFPQLQRLEPQLSENHSSAEFEESLEGLMDRLQRLRPLTRR